MIMFDDEYYVERYMEYIYYDYPELEWEEEDLGAEMPEEEDFVF